MEDLRDNSGTLNEGVSFLLSTLQVCSIRLYQPHKVSRSLLYVN